MEGKRFSTLPASINQAAAVRPVYETLTGWQEEICEVRDFRDLPVQARDYIKRIEDLTEVKADIVSVGPDREETLLLHNPFDK
jgi:adenylosuccinate synthase